MIGRASPPDESGGVEFWQVLAGSAPVRCIADPLRLARQPRIVTDGRLESLGALDPAVRPHRQVSRFIDDPAVPA